MMKNYSRLLVVSLLMGLEAGAKNRTDTLPDVLSQKQADLICHRLQKEAALRYARYTLPSSETEWVTYKRILKRKIIKKAGVVIHPDLPLHVKETASVAMPGYKVKNISFQTLPEVYATANLYVPDGKGPFPAVIVMMGHSDCGRFFKEYQPIGHMLARNGYVSLCIDPFGSGERTTVHGINEYHGGNLGASLMNIGESLMGIQVSENMRGVDLLQSLPCVDDGAIGATGASGGGNQTMWLAAIDERIRASMPVVSVGTFESYVMRTNCVCELLIDGLTFTEEAGVLAMVAPRAIKICNHKKDSNPTFYPDEMLRSFANAAPVFQMLDAPANITTQIFDMPHGYLDDDRYAVLGWFNLHLKGTGNGAPLKDTVVTVLPQEELMTFRPGERDRNVVSIPVYCKTRGEALRNSYLATASFNKEQKRKELQAILGIDRFPGLKHVNEYHKVDGWQRVVLTSDDEKVIPLLHIPPAGNNHDYILLCNSQGKKNIPATIINGYKKSGKGLVIAELSGAGELSSVAEPQNRASVFFNRSRAEIWLGRTIIGVWTNELGLICAYMRTQLEAGSITIDGNKEAGLAALFLTAFDKNIEQLKLRNCPLSYLFDQPGNLDFFTMGIHLPGILKWGDISLAAAIGARKISFIDPLTMSGNRLTHLQLEGYRKEFDRIKQLTAATGTTLFEQTNKLYTNEK